MSYSRWSDSVWYTFWCVSHAKRKEDEIFSVCTMGDFTYAQLVSSIESCLDECCLCKYHEGKDFAPIEDATPEQREELRGYMQQFIDDVDNEYKSEARKKYESGEISEEDYLIEDL